MTTLRLLIALPLGPGLAVAWSILHPDACWILIFPGFAFAILFAYAWTTLSLHRRIIADAYFQKRHVLYAFARSPTRIFVSAFFSAALLTIALFAAIPTLSPEMMIALVADAGVAAAFYLAADSLLRGPAGVRPAAAGVLARQWATGLNSVLLVAVLVTLSLRSPAPLYIDPDWRVIDTLENAAATRASRCDSVDLVLGLGRQLDAVRWLAIGKVTNAVDNAWIRYGLWGLFLLNGAALAAGYSRLCVQLVHTARGPRTDGA